jgi:hypothetical protein
MNSSLRARVDEIKEAIRIAFAGAKRPAKRQIAEHKCEECKALTETFAPLKWDSIKPEIIESNFDQLPLFSVPAYHYFLPAYILRCLDDFDPSSIVCEFTIYSLSPALNTPEERDWYEARQHQFTESETKAILAFLLLVQSIEAFIDFRSEAETGVRHWQKVSSHSAT